MGAVTEIIRSGVAEGKVRDDIPPEEMATLFLGLIRARFSHPPQGNGGSRAAEMIVELFCNGISRAPAAAKKKTRAASARRAGAASGSG